MTLRAKTFMIVGLTLVCLIAVLYGSSQFILERSFVELETQSVRQNVQRVRSALTDAVVTLDTMLFDWSAWDDTYEFVQHPYDEYVISNLVNETFVSNRLGLMVFVNGAGEVVWGQGFDLIRSCPVPIPPCAQQRIADRDLLLQHADPQSRHAGIILCEDQPMFIVSRPILTSLEEGPIRGTMIMGRLLDTAEISRLSEITQLSLVAYPVNDPALSTDLSAALDLLTKSEPILVRPLDLEKVAGYTLTEDLYGQPALVWRIDLPRQIYQQGQRTIAYLMSALLVGGLVFGGVTLLLVERVVLARLAQLDADVRAVSVRGDLGTRVSARGGDELSGLADGINRMLEALEHSQQEMKHSEEQLRTVVQNMPAMMVAFDQGGRIMVWNQECERVTGYSAEEIIGNPMAMDLLWPDEQYRKRMVAEWFARGYDYRDWEWRIACRDGHSRMVAWANISKQFPIPGWESWSIGIDITDRLEAQSALEQRLAEQETLFSIGRLISSSLDADRIMHQVAEQIAHLAGAGCCVISDWDPAQAALTVKARYVHPGQGQQTAAYAEIGYTYGVADRPTIGASLAAQRPLTAYSTDMSADLVERQRLLDHGWAGMTCIPIAVLDEVIGLVEVYLVAESGPFSVHDMQLMQSLVDQVAVAIHNARLFAEVQAGQTALRGLSLRLINAQEQERRIVAQELHDELGQLLTALKINIDLARRRVPEQAVVLKRRLEEASALTDQVLTNVRTLTVELRPTLLDDMGIVPTLRWQAKLFAQRTGVEMVLDLPDLPRLPTEIETTLYRVAQEALTNVARHAEANQVQVVLDYADQAVTLVVEDDGRGFEVAEWLGRQREHPSLGLTGIQERVMLLNGRVNIQSHPGGGTRIEIVLPTQSRQGGESC